MPAAVHLFHGYLNLTLKLFRTLKLSNRLENFSGQNPNVLTNI